MKDLISFAFVSIGAVCLVAFTGPKPQDTPSDSTTLRPSHTNVFTLSSEDKAELHTSFFMGPIGTASGVSGPVRTLSFACYVTVDEVWEASLIHGIDCVDLRTSSAVILGAGWNDEYHSITVTPLAGMTWGKVKDANDLIFAMPED